MFEQLQEQFEKTFRALRGLGKIRESNIKDALQEVKASLLEADVQYRVVQSFVDSVRDRALGTKVLDSVDPGQQFIKIVHDELARLLGGENSPEIPTPTGRTWKVLIVGLQGSGKTTTAAKVARYLRNELKWTPLLIPADTQRPGAREQLEQLGQANSLSVFQSRESKPHDVVRQALRAVELKEIAANCLVFDTAGRLHVDEDLMEELISLRDLIKPDWVLYVLDSMVGQDAVRAAEIFAEKIGFDGVILTKLDGDARGGAAFSVHMATGKPITFVGTGEGIDALERFHPDRHASRVLGMGDVVTLVEKAQTLIDEEKAHELAKKIRRNEFTIDDFQEQLQMVQKMGSIGDLLGMIPGAGQLKKLAAAGLPDEELKKVSAVIHSMSRQERNRPDILNGSRRKRIADGSGTTVADVNRFLKQFLQVRTMMSRLSRAGKGGGKSIWQ